MIIKSQTILICENIDIRLPEIQQQIQLIERSIVSTCWPPENDHFAINTKKNDNGVKPIKTACMRNLSLNNWKLEFKIDLGATQKRPGPVDAAIETSFGYLALEWETGNISSSHRSLNRLALGLYYKKLIGGFLLLPSTDLYYYLTDRVGNYSEIEPYFPIWKNLKIEKGFIIVYEMEYDKLDPSLPSIPKGRDGMSKKK